MEETNPSRRLSSLHVWSQWRTVVNDNLSADQLGTYHFHLPTLSHALQTYPLADGPTSNEYYLLKYTATGGHLAASSLTPHQFLRYGIPRIDPRNTDPEEVYDSHLGPSMTRGNPANMRNQDPGEAYDSHIGPNMTRENPVNRRSKDPGPNMTRENPAQRRTKDPGPNMTRENPAQRRTKDPGPNMTRENPAQRRTKDPGPNMTRENPAQRRTKDPGPHMKRRNPGNPVYGDYPNGEVFARYIDAQRGPSYPEPEYYRGKWPPNGPSGNHARADDDKMSYDFRKPRPYDPKMHVDAYRRKIP